MAAAATATNSVWEAEDAVETCTIKLEVARSKLVRAEEALGRATAEAREPAKVKRAARSVLLAAERVEQAEKMLSCLQWQLQGARRRAATAAA